MKDEVVQGGSGEVDFPIDEFVLVVAEEASSADKGIFEGELGDVSWERSLIQTLLFED